MGGSPGRMEDAIHLGISPASNSSPSPGLRHHDAERPHQAGRGERGHQEGHAVAEARGTCHECHPLQAPFGGDARGLGAQGIEVGISIFTSEFMAWLCSAGCRASTG